MAALLFGVSADGRGDVLVGGAYFLGSVALVASSVPAFRATRVDPRWCALNANDLSGAFVGIREPKSFTPSFPTIADQHQLSEMICVMVCDQERLPQQRLAFAPRNSGIGPARDRSAGDSNAAIYSRIALHDCRATLPRPSASARTANSPSARGVTRNRPTG